MKFITTKTETSLADLTSQMFGFKGSKSAVDLKRAQAALREANPQLGDLTKLPAGTVVIVPDVPGVPAAPTQSFTGVSADMVAQLKQVLAGAETVLHQAVASQTSQADTSLSLVKNRAVINLVKPLPDLQSRLSQIASQTKTQIKQLDADKKTQLQGLAQLGKDLGSLNS